MLARFFIVLLVFTMTVFGSIGRITALSGNISIERGSKKEKAAPNYQLEEKDVIVSGAGATAQIVFNDKTVVTVGSSTNFKIEEYLFGEKDNKARFSVGEGAFKTITGKIGKVAPDKFKVETKTATIGIRGTIFVGNVDKSGVLTVACTKGAISVTPNIPAGMPTLVKEGQITKADTKGVEPPKAFTPQDMKNLEKSLTTDKKAQSEAGGGDERREAGSGASARPTAAVQQTSSEENTDKPVVGVSEQTAKKPQVALSTVEKSVSGAKDAVANAQTVANNAATENKATKAVESNAPVASTTSTIATQTAAATTASSSATTSIPTASPWSYTVIASADAQLLNNALKVTYGGSTKYFKYIGNTNTYGTDETFSSIGELVAGLQAFVGADVKFYLDPTTNKISYGAIGGNANSLMISKAIPSSSFLGFKDTPLIQTGNMISNTHRSAMATLSDGNVFSYGGFDGSNHLPVSQIYNPTTGVWSAATNTNVPSLGEGVGIIPLAGGRAMLAGGWSTGPHYETWFWDNTSGWTQGANMLNSGDFTPSSPTYVDVADQVLAKAGGKIYSIAKNRYVQYYDTADSAWHWFDQQQYTPQFSGHSGVALSGSYADKILVFGGSSPATYLFDPSLGNIAGAWSPKSSMLVSSSFGSSVLLANGNVLSIGGVGLNAIQMYNPSTDTWSYKTPLPFTFAYGSAAAINNGTSVLLAGGQQDGLYSANSYILTPSVEPSIQSTGSMAYSRVGFAMTKLQDGSAFAIGGFNYSPINYDVQNPEKYDPATKQWTLLNPSGSFAPRMGLAAATLSGGNVLVAGGTDGWGSMFNYVDMYDVTANAWVSKTALPTSRYGLALAALTNNQALAIGGYDTVNSMELKEALLFNPNANSGAGSWTAVAPMHTARIGLSAVTLQSGKVLAIGGSNASGYLNSVEMYDPVGDNWVYKASLLTPRTSLASVLLSDGNVLAIGGSTTGNVALSSIEQYNPVADSWFYKVPLPFTFSGGGAVALNDGSVLVASGKQDENIVTTSSWLYNPNQSLTDVTNTILAADYNAGINNGFFIGASGATSKVVGNINSMLFRGEPSAAGLDINANGGQLSGTLGSLNGYASAPSNFDFSHYSSPSAAMVNYLGEDSKIIWGAASINGKAGTIGFSSLPDKVDGSNALSNINDFSSWGYWEAKTSDSSEYYSGYWVSGQPTPDLYIQQMISQKQTYNYAGHVLGDTLNANNARDSIVFDANNKLGMTVNFGQSNPITVNSLSFKTSKGWSYSQSTNLTSTSPSLTNTNGYTATIGNSVNTSDVLNMQGKFYGPQANSTGGVFAGQLTGTDATARNVQGAFKATRQ